ncbi:MAG TPA: FAD-binding and (Fe-S)-binding domain-containing protein [Anaeromyxobacteraceae bacterium]
MIPRLSPELPASPPVYGAFLEALRAAGFEGEISETHGDRTVLATDNSIYQIPPRALLFPRHAEDVRRIARLAGEARFAAVKLAPRGGGTGTNAQSLTDGLVVDLSRHMNRILEIDAAGRWARVEAGVVKDQLDAALAPHGLFFAPELSTSNRATLGGMVNTDASGQGSCLYGKTRDHVLELRTILLGGESWRSTPLDDAELAAVKARQDRVGAIHRAVDAIARENEALVRERFPRLNRCLTGYDLAHVRDARGRFDLNAVLCGSEGTLGFVVEARLNVLPIPRFSALVNLRYGDFDGALRDAPALMTFRPSSIETVDGTVLGLARQDVVWPEVKPFFPDDPEGPAQAVNLVEFVGHAPEDVEEPLRRLVAALAAEGPRRGRRGHTVARGADVKRVWGMRKKGVGLLGNLAGEARPIAFVEDTAVPPVHLADYIAELRGVLDARGLTYGMFGHVDAGVLHVRPALDLRDPAQEPLVRLVTDDVARLTQKYGGLLWGEHGKGVRSEYAPAFFGPLYPALQALKVAFDPSNQLNPGKIATPPGAALLAIDRLPTRGQAERTIPPAVRHSFEGALQCNGNALCFDFDADDAMCPSWKATRQRRHSPKGRAVLLREWLRLLAAAGADPLEEARRARAPGWSTFPARLAHTLGRWLGRPDFSHEVMEAMEGCLSCKACSSQCPIKVDVTELRSRFLELYRGRYLRPPRDYFIGFLESLLPVLARLAPLYNAAAGSALGRFAARRLGLVAVPLLSRVPFEREAAARGVARATPAALEALSPAERARSVVVVQDAFTRFFDAGLVLDVLELLSRLGRRAWLAPLRPNGKALHIHGFRAAFERAAARNAAVLNDLARTGVPLVGIDPAMTLTYRSDYAAALGRADLPQVLLLQEWLLRATAGAAPRPPARAYRLLGHCTERTNAPESLRQWQVVFERLGLSLRVEANGCCGMAGTYGHLAEQRPTSEAIYRLSWGRHLAAAPPDDPPLATGYSCRSQAELVDGVRLPHPAQALLQVLRQAPPSIPAASGAEPA